LSGLQFSVEAAVDSVENNSTEDIGNGRRRARLCRRLKHVELSAEQTERCLTVILQRLATGDFSQNFKDEIGLAVHLDSARTFKVALSLIEHPKQYIAKYATWIINKIQVREVCAVSQPIAVSCTESPAKVRYVEPALAAHHAAAEAARIAWLAKRREWADAEIALWGTKNAMKWVRAPYQAGHLDEMQAIEQTKLRQLSSALSQAKKDLHKARFILQCARLNSLNELNKDGGSFN
jgi:hypothetical protein